ncbi:MAG: hypothetical protein IPK85_04860 [Gemmatimonadetes bacterium]|nr:hypothetical protein [Gemmatimonadota bacterium]
MTPHSPILLITAVRAAARLHDGHLNVPHVDPMTSLRFVQAIGGEAHAALWGGHTSWPLQPAMTVADLEALAERRKMLRARPRAADVMVADIDGARIAGVIDEVHDLASGRHLVSCSVVVARGHGRHTRVTRTRRLCGLTRGDLFIRWYDHSRQEAA